MLLDEAVSFIQHYNTIIYNTYNDSHRQRLIIMKQNIISEFISAEERRNPRNQMNKHGVLTHFYQQDIELINEAAERLGIPRSEFIRQACRTFINMMNDSTPPKRLSSPNVNVKLNESDSDPLAFYSSSGTGF